MPQKRNPDVAELARGKSGRLHGNLVTLLTLLKGLPTGYNRDLQEDKEALFDTCITLGITVPALAGGIKTAEFVPETLESAIDTQLFATDLADYLVKKGVPFRETHGIVGRLVRLAEEERIPLNELSIEAMQNEHVAFEEDVVGVFDWERSTEVRDTVGGTSLRAIEEQLEEVSAQLSGINTAVE
jgi:argininosuccinate lyase